MKSLTLITLFFAFLAQASASVSCGTLDYGTLETIYSKSVGNDKNFNSWEINLLMKHVDDRGHFYDDEMNVLTTFEEIEKSMSDSFEELHITLFRNTMTGQKFVYVWSYPGDNEYGMWFTTKGDLVGEIHDGDLLVDGEYCGYDWGVTL